MFNRHLQQWPQLKVIKGTEYQHVNVYKDISNDWNDADICIFTSLLVSGLENVKHLIFVEQHVRETLLNITGICTTGKK